MARQACHFLPKFDATDDFMISSVVFSWLASFCKDAAEPSSLWIGLLPVFGMSAEVGKWNITPPNESSLSKSPKTFCICVALCRVLRVSKIFDTRSKVK